MLTLLRAYQHRAPIRQELTPEQRTWLEEVFALAIESARHKPTGMTSDHSDLYDEFGLPR